MFRSQLCICNTCTYVAVYVIFITIDSHACSYKYINLFLLFSGIKVYFDPQNYTTSEGDGSVPLTIVVDKVPAKDVTVTVTTMDITAEGNSYFIYLQFYQNVLQIPIKTFTTRFT